MNNNELAESQVQNIRDEAELRSTAVLSHVHNCVKMLRKYLNTSRVLGSREEHPLR